MSQPESIVIIVAQDEGSCRSVQALLRSECLTSIVFRSIGEYVEFCRPNLPSCLVMDVQLPDGNGLEFQRRVEDGHPPIVFISDHCDVRSSVRAIKSGAVNFLTKPLSEIELMDSIYAAIDQDRKDRLVRGELSRLRQRLSSLTPREREVLPLIVSGLLNKQAAAILGISEITLQIHRRRIMQKMQAESLPDLVRIAQRLQVPIVHSRRASSLGLGPMPVQQRPHPSGRIVTGASYRTASAEATVPSSPSRPI